MARKRKSIGAMIVPVDIQQSSRRGIVAVCDSVESARLAFIAHAGRSPRIYQRNVHAEDCDTYVHVVIADIVK